MIKIRCVKKPEVSYTLLGGTKYPVGRKSGKITFPDDQSISRNHAEIELDHPIANIFNPSLTPMVVITDIGSKFGTFVKDGIENKIALATREGMTLTHGDRFRFGLQWNEFEILYTPLITTTSTLKDAENLKTAICKLGGHVIPEWAEGCEYVIMDQLTLTIKAVCALLSAKYIVTPQYFWDYLSAVESSKEPPKPLDYIPPLAENQLSSNVVSFAPEAARTRLFKGLTFLFATSKHAKKLGVAITAGGGTLKLMNEVRLADVCNRNILIIPPMTDLKLCDDEVQRVIKKYTDGNKRLIQESEIGLAAVYKSVEKHCNPYHSFASSLMPRSLASQTQKNANTLVQETQSLDSEMVSGVNVVEESFAIPTPANRSLRVKVEDEEEEEEEDSGPTTRNKRKLGKQDITPEPKRTRTTRSSANSNLTKENEDLLGDIFNMGDSLESQPAPTPSPRRATRSSGVAPVVPGSEELVNIRQSQLISPKKTPPAKETPKESSSSAAKSLYSNAETLQAAVEDVEMAVGNGETAEGSGSNKRKAEESEVNEEEPVESKEGIKRVKKEPELPVESPMKAAERMLLERAKKLNLEPAVKEEPKIKVELKPLDVAFAPLIKKENTRLVVEVIENGQVRKNFKRFAKVLPNPLYQGTPSEPQQENRAPSQPTKKIVFSEDAFDSYFAGPPRRPNGDARVKLPRTLSRDGERVPINGNGGGGGAEEDLFDLSTDHVDQQQQGSAAPGAVAAEIEEPPQNTFEEIIHQSDNAPQPEFSDVNVANIPPRTVDFNDEWSF